MTILKPAWRTAALAAASLALAAGPAPAANPDRSCALSVEDQAWLDRAVAAWQLTSERITGIARIPAMRALVFDSGCVAQSATAMTGGATLWNGRSHSGQIALPGGGALPAQVASFASGEGEGAFFTMAAPSIWRSAEVDGGALGLETLMTAVLLHEATHGAQIPTYGRAITRLTKAHGLSDDFNDDSIQQRFERDPDFAASMTAEIDLLFAAAAAADPADSRRLARQARRLMTARHERWFTGADAYLAEAEDLWLTMEGSGQWAAYRWLTDREGGGLDEATALPGFGRRGKWWSQTQGLAMFLLLDRLSDGSWKQSAFGNGSRTVLQMLDEALAAPAD